MEELPINYVKYKGERFLPVTSTKAVVNKDGVSVEDLLLQDGNIYEFAKSEYDKTLNLYTPGKNSNYFVGYLEAGKTYSISADLTIPSGTTLYTGTIHRYNIETGGTSDLNGGITRTYKTFATSGRNSYTLTCNISGHYQIETFNQPSGVSITNIMLNEGNTALPYQEYNGAIVHRKEFDKLANYTMEEKSIGTWIDGRTIYRTIYYVVVSANSTGTVDISGLGYNEAWVDFGNSFCHYSGLMTSSGVTWCNQPTTNSDYGLVYINGNYIMNVKNNASTTRYYYITLNFTR